MGFGVRKKRKYKGAGKYTTKIKEIQEEAKCYESPKRGIVF